jgi:hypothetical protein
MALFIECMLKCAAIRIDTADIIRDGDFSTVVRFFRDYFLVSEASSGMIG